MLGRFHRSNPLSCKTSSSLSGKREPANHPISAGRPAKWCHLAKRRQTRYQQAIYHHASNLPTFSFLEVPTVHGRSPEAFWSDSHLPRVILTTLDSSLAGTFAPSPASPTIAIPPEWDRNSERSNKWVQISSRQGSTLQMLLTRRLVRGNASLAKPQ